MNELLKQKIIDNKTYLGIELGSTRIKAVMIDDEASILATAAFNWENKFENSFWTYDLDYAIIGVQTVYKDLKEKIQESYGITLESIGAIGISAMMHGFIALDKNDKLLTPFRTWRNSNTSEARNILIDQFSYNIPHRWSVAHLFQALISKEAYVEDIAYMTTLSGYIHYLLTGEKYLGIGDASGMFPIDYTSLDYDKVMIEKMNVLLNENNSKLNIADILPTIKIAGEKAGSLTEAGVKLLDPSGDLKPGIFMAAPEGDAQTGMIATNAIEPKTGNISVGTSIFSMIVLEEDLEKYYEEIDIVATPDGYPVAMVHANNGVSDFDSWINLMREFMSDNGFSFENDGDFYKYIYLKALAGDPDCGNVLSYNLLSGEPIVDIYYGRPMVIRKEDSNFNLSNLLLSNLYSTMATIRIGQDILTVGEGVAIESLVAHGGVFNTPGGMQKITAAGLNVPVDVYESAGDGGPWGMALLTLFAKESQGEKLNDFLNIKVFNDLEKLNEKPDPDLVEGFNVYLDRYKNALTVVKEAENKF